MKNRRGAAAALLTLLVPALACSARRSEPVAGPLEVRSAEVVRGAAAFDRTCSQCHPGGERGLAPAINNKPLPGGLIRFQVRHGLGAMPAFSESELSPEDLDSIVAYLEALRRNGRRR